MAVSRQQFEEVFELASKELLEELVAEFEMPPSAVTWMKELTLHSVKGGKMNRGLTVVHSYQVIRQPEELSPEELQNACILGWCVEWLQAFFLVADDIMDQSETRRGLPCWYKTAKPIDGANGETVNLIACNDSLLLEGSLYRVLRKHLRGHPGYASMLELFHETTYQTTLGQLLDLTSQPDTRVNNLDLFTIETYNKIVKYKTAFYSFYLPVALALALAGLDTDENLKAAKDILLPMGEYFQVQDDFLDCYGAPEVIGKIGRDIEENKCGWLVVQALKRCTPEQRQILQENYGKEDPENVKRVKELYAELDLTTVFKNYEEESYESLKNMINNFKGTFPAQCLTDLLAKIYKRSL